MIQRIQSLYLLLAIAVCAAMFFLPVYTGMGPASSVFQNPSVILSQEALKVNFPISPDQTDSAKKFIVLMNTLDIVLIALSFAGLFMFRTREVQLKLTRYLILFSLLYIVFLATGIYKAHGLMTDIKDHFEIGAFIPILLPIFLFLATRGISKDIKLVKSADRLR